MLKHSCASWKWSGNLLLFFDIPLGVIRILGQTRPLLLGLEQAGGSWLASAEVSYHGSTGFLSSNYIHARSMLQVPGILFEEIVFEAPDASGSPFWTLWAPFRRHTDIYLQHIWTSTLVYINMSHHGLGEQRCSYCTFAPLHGGDSYIYKGHVHIYMYI